MYFTIYKITNKINGKTYIGKHQTENLNDGYFGSGNGIKYAIAKYGKDNFVKEILHVFDNESDMNAKEAELVTEEFCKRLDTYNIMTGGYGDFNFITPEERTKNAKKGISCLNKKLDSDPMFRQQFYKKRTEAIRNVDWSSINLIGRTHTKISKDKMREKALGRKRSELSIKFQKINSLGEKNSQYGTRWSWITDGQTNKKVPYLEDKDIPEGWKRGRSRTGQLVESFA